MPPQAVRIEGLRELDRAFKLYGLGLERGVREALETAAEVVKPDAQSLASVALKPGKVPWSSMRVGVTKHTSYVAPTQKGRNPNPRRRRGQKFTNRMLDRALEPALERNIFRVEREFADALDDLGRMWSRV